MRDPCPETSRHGLARVAGALIVVAALGPAPLLAASATLEKVKSIGAVRCGVSEGIAGFSIKDAAGRWSGLDADFCRAVAAAALGDASKVIFVPLRASARFPALRGSQIDLLARNTTWTLVREAALNVQFAGVLYFDGQGFMVPVKSGLKTLARLKGATVCVEKGTTSAQNLADYSAERGLGIKALVIDSAVEVADAFFAGKCRAFTADTSQLAAARLRAPGGPAAFSILPERISKEPLGPVVRAGDDDWFTLVRWVLFALVGLEEAGITRDNVRSRIDDPVVQRALGAGEDISKALGVDNGWALRAVQSVGNYGEMFERNLGRASPLKIERGLNRLWTQGGLMYAPPVR
jgi:general L-amino acid transport system substrate-binding protein